MGKIKGKNKGLSDQVRNRKQAKKSGAAQSVRTNPFEIKVNKQKHKIIGKNLTKFDRGVPGVSRSKAIKKRQETLLVEFKNKRKTNRLVDHRIGENDASASLEDKMLGRFAAEGKKRHAKSSVFNIDGDDDDGDFDEMTLTHKGQSLLEIEKFDRPADSDEDEEDDTGNLRGDIVSEGHFGGGILQKKAGNEAEQEKSWKDRMEEMIAKTKMAKHERQTEKDEVVQMTDKLDDEWRVLHNIVAATKIRDDGEHRAPDDFDITVNELKYESRGNPTDRLKTEAEVAKIEKEKLDKLEKQRLARMRGEQNKSRSHQSADDLDDGMDYGMDDGEDDDFEVKYKDGKLLSTNEPEQSSDEEEDDSEGDDDSDDEEEEEEGSEEDESGSEEEDDEYSDLESDQDEDENEESFESDKVELNAPPEKKKRKQSQAKSSDEPYSNIPFTFTIPDTYTQLIEMVDKYELDEQNVVIERMRKCHHASLAEENKIHLIRLYGFLLEYFGDLALRCPVPVDMLDKLTAHLYELSTQFPLQTSQHSKHIITERQKLFSLYCQSKGGRGVWPFLDLLMYMKLMSRLYPTSDFRHEAITPCMLFSSQIYNSCAITNHRDVSVGLMLTTIMAEYVSFSKAVMPECINFLSVLFNAASPSKTTKVSVGTATCRANLLKCKACGNDLRSQEIKPFNLNQVIVRGVGNSIYNTDQFVLTALWTAVSLLKKFLTLYNTTPAAEALFHHSKQALSNIDLEDYPEKLKTVFEELRESLQAVGPSKFDYVCRERKKPKVLRLYEPAIEDDWEAGKKKIKDKVAAEKMKLKQQYKKEMKATVREVRKDRAFIQDQTIKERIKRDSERNKKTNQILSDLQGQQHDINMHKKMSKPTQRQKSGRRK